MLRILFVCTGNTCRSPMAEVILKSKQLPHIEVKSAGILAIDGSDISQNAAIVLDENNHEYAHQSAMLTKEHVEWATHILTMTWNHKWSVTGQYPHTSNKTFTLKEFVEEGGDVQDPYGGTADIYRMTYKEIDALMEKVIKKLGGKKGYVNESEKKDS